MENDSRNWFSEVLHYTSLCIKLSSESTIVKWQARCVDVDNSVAPATLTATALDVYR